MERIQKIPNTTVAVMEPGEMSVIHLNVTKPPLDNVLVRRAVAHAVNRAEVVQFKGEAVTRPSLSVVPEGYLGFTNDVPTYPHDPDRARELLAEAGFPDGVSLSTIHTTLPGMLSTMEAVQAQLKKAGIDLEITTVEHATFHAQIRLDLSQVVHYSAARFPVADVYLTQFYDSDSIVGKPTEVTNFSRCDVADAEIRAARVEPDAEKQLALWATAQRMILEASCSVPVYQGLQLWAWTSELDLGVEANGTLNLSPPVTEMARFASN